MRDIFGSARWIFGTGSRLSIQVHVYFYDLTALYLFWSEGVRGSWVWMLFCFVS
jgi:hypothetical protein